MHLQYIVYNTIVDFLVSVYVFCDSVVLRVLYSILGLVVREESVENRDTSCRIITTNHITPFDHLAVSIILPCVTVRNCISNCVCSTN